VIFGRRSERNKWTWLGALQASAFGDEAEIVIAVENVLLVVLSTS